MNQLTEITREWANEHLNPYGHVPRPLAAVKDRWAAQAQGDVANRVEGQDADGFSHIYLDAPISDELHRALYEEWFGTDVIVSARSFNKALEATTGDVMVHINSPGGAFFEAVEMYAALDARKRKGDKVICSIDGLCASAATIVLVAGSETQITNLGTFMAHFVLAGTFIYEYGFVEDLESAWKKLGNQIGQIRKLNAQFVKEYSQKFGKTEAEMRALMEKEEFFVGEQAVSEGFVDRLIEDAPEAEQAQVGNQAEIEEQVNNETPTEFRARVLKDLQDAHGTNLFAV